VELKAGSGDVSFTASAAGATAAAKADLPVAATPVTRWMNFVVDRITGTVFKPRELPFLHRYAVEERAQRERIVWLQAADLHTDYEVEDLIAHLFRDDEHFIGMEAAGDRLMERFALVLVRNGMVEGLPARAPERLVEAILNAASKAGDAKLGQPVILEAPASEVLESNAPPARAVTLADDDLLIGGKANEEALIQLIGHARERVTIHSTFVSKKAFERLKPYLLDASRKGARIDLMWGESDDPKSAGRTRAAVAEIRATLEASGEDELVRLHPFSTRSHAKFVIADRSGGSPAALIGSCNWLSTDMTLLEASVRLRDPRIVADVIYQAAELSRGRDGHWNELTSQLASYAAVVSDLPGPKSGNATAQLIFAPDHRALLRHAIETAQQDLFLVSHRVSASARQALLVPLGPALAARPALKVEVRFGASPDATEQDWNAIAEGHDLSRVIVIAPRKPEAHAKLLGWDNDDVVVSSQNWLSADPSTSNPRREFGIRLHSAGLAKRLHAALIQAST
jgi:cardiolipin synthase A/B